MEWFEPFATKQLQKKYLDSFAEQNNIKNSMDWGKVSKASIIASGGYPLLRKYGNSIFHMLQDIYPGILYPISC